MKQLYLDLGMGAAGDMLAAALFDLLDNEDQAAFLSLMEHAGIPGTQIRAEKVIKSGISGTAMRVWIHGAEEGAGMHEHEHEHEHTHEHEHDHEHEHSHEHEHEHGHEHSHEHEHEHEHGHEHHHGHGHHHEHHSMDEIRSTIMSLRIPDAVKEHVFAVYRLIADAESRVHGMPVSEVHLHEVGMLDAIADITAVCVLIDLLAPDRIAASPVTTGYGSVHCAHGILPVPAPATALLLQGLPVKAGDIEGELCTPTGAALVKHFVTHFGEADVMAVDRYGYGMGKKTFSRLNCIRASIGETMPEKGRPAFEEAPASEVVELSCNIDDMTGEAIGFAVGELLASGALDVWTTPVQMKKNRPGCILSVLCQSADREAFVRHIFRLTTTIGVRETLHRRYELDRRTVSEETREGTVRYKVVSGYGVERRKPEYEDLAAIARKNGGSLTESAAQI